jgi:hypothetical protein
LAVELSVGKPNRSTEQPPNYHLPHDQWGDIATEGMGAKDGPTLLRARISPQNELARGGDAIPTGSQATGDPVQKESVMLKIVKAIEPMPVENIVLTVYSQPGLGKTSLGFTAESPLLLDFDKGSYRAANRRDAMQVANWVDVESMTAIDLEPYKTIVIDTGGRALDILSLDIIRSNPKMGNFGSLSLQGFGVLKGRFAQWQTFLRSLGKDIVIACHMSEEKRGDDLLERIDAQGSSKNEIYKSSDAMCRIQVDNGGNRYLNFDPREGGFGKNPAQLPRLQFPHPDKNPHFLADVIAQIKASINKMTEAQGEAVKEMDAWKAAVDGAESVEDINTLVKVAVDRKHGAPMKSILSEHATALGFTFDAKAKHYTDPEAKAEAAEA